MSLFGKVDGVIMGLVIFAMGMAGGWSLRDKPFWPGAREAMLLPDKDHGVYCMVKGADVVCRLAPPNWSAMQFSGESMPVKGVHFAHAMDPARQENRGR